MHSNRHHRGQSMVEFIIVTPVMFLLVFGSIQFALLYQAKTTLNYATFEAARAGALNNANETAMKLAFARAMAAMYYVEDKEDISPIYGVDTDDIDDYDENTRTGRAMIGRTLAYADINADGSKPAFAEFQVLNPTADSFADHGVDDDGTCRIPSDNLMYRDATVKGASSQTIQDANLLKLRVVYCYPLHVPFVNRMLVALLTTVPDEACPYCVDITTTGSIERTCLDNNRFPINAQAIVRMQSPATIQGACP